MIVQINAANIESSPALENAAHHALESALQYVKDKVTRVEVHLHDDNAAKSAAKDKRCTMEARIAGQQPLAVNHASDDFYQCINETAQKLSRAVATRLDKLATK